MNLLVSIIVPAYNQANYLPEALNSVQAQTYTNWECIIVNDGSPDNTEKVALNFCKKDVRFKYIKKENGGLSSARNAGLNEAKGDWIQFLDSDDYIEPEKLRLSIDLIRQNPDLQLVVSNFKMFAGKPANATPAFCEIKQDYLNFDNVLFEWGGAFVIPIHCGLFKKSLFNLLKFNESFKAIEDWIMWLDLFRVVTSSKYLDVPLAYYRNNPQSMTKDNTFFRTSIVKAYKHILDSIPEKDVKRFSHIAIDRLSTICGNVEADLRYVKKSPAFRAEKKIKDVLRKLIRRNYK